MIFISEIMGSLTVDTIIANLGRIVSIITIVSAFINFFRKSQKLYYEITETTDGIWISVWNGGKNKCSEGDIFGNIKLILDGEKAFFRAYSANSHVEITSNNAKGFNSTLGVLFHVLHVPSVDVSNLKEALDKVGNLYNIQTVRENAFKWWAFCSIAEIIVMGLICFMEYYVSSTLTASLLVIFFITNIALLLIFLLTYFIIRFPHNGRKLRKKKIGKKNIRLPRFKSVIFTLLAILVFIGNLRFVSWYSKNPPTMTIGNNWYFVQMADISWEDANNASVDKGGKLATFENMDDFNRINKSESFKLKYKDCQLYIGGKRPWYGNDFNWMSGNNKYLSVITTDSDNSCWIGSDEPSSVKNKEKAIAYATELNDNIAIETIEMNNPIPDDKLGDIENPTPYNHYNATINETVMAMCRDWTKTDDSWGWFDTTNELDDSWKGRTGYLYVKYIPSSTLIASMIFREII